MSLLPNVIKATQYSGVDETKAVATSAASVVNMRRMHQTAEEIKRTIQDEAMEKAQSLIEETRDYCEQLRRKTAEQLEEEVQRVQSASREEGYAAGFQNGQAQGYRDGYARGQQEAAEAMRETALDFTAAVEDCERQKDWILKQFEQDIQALALSIAKKVVRTELNVNRKTMAAIITSATEAYRGQEWMKITVSAKTAEVLDELDDEEIGWNEVSTNVKIIGDPSFRDTDCTIELPDLLIDAGANTQLSRIKKALDISDHTA